MDQLEYVKRYAQVLESHYTLQSLERYLNQQLMRIPRNPYEPEHLPDREKNTELSRLEQKTAYADRWRTHVAVTLMRPPLLIQMAITGIRYAISTWVILRLSGLAGLLLQKVMGGPVVAFLTWIREMPWLMPKLLGLSELLMLLFYFINIRSEAIVSSREEFYRDVEKEQVVAERAYKLQLTLLDLEPLRRMVEMNRKLYEDKHILPDSCQTYVAADLLCSAMETGEAENLEKGVALAEKTVARDDDLKDPHRAEARWKFFCQIPGVETLHQRNVEAMQLVETLLSGSEPLERDLPAQITDWLKQESQKQIQFRNWIQQEAGSPASG